MKSANIYHTYWFSFQEQDEKIDTTLSLYTNHTVRLPGLRLMEVSGFIREIINHTTAGIVTTSCFYSSLTFGQSQASCFPLFSVFLQSLANC